MRQSLHEYMKPAIVHFMIFPELISGRGPIVETLIGLVTDPFFRAVEIGPIADAAVLGSVASILRQARVECAYDGQPWTLVPGLNLGAIDDKARETAVAAMKTAITQAAALGSKTCGVMSGKLGPADERECAFGRLTESMVELCRFAAPSDITLCLENFDTVPYSKNCLIGPTSEAVRLAEAVRGKVDNFGLLLDLGHFPIMEEQPRDAVIAASEHLKRVQIGNCSTDPYSAYYGDVHPYYGAPRTSVDIGQLAEFLSALIEIGFLRQGGNGIVGFEMKPGAGDNAQAIIAGSKRALSEAWALASDGR